MKIPRLTYKELLSFKPCWFETSLGTEERKQIRRLQAAVKKKLGKGKDLIDILLFEDQKIGDRSIDLLWLLDMMLSDTPFAKAFLEKHRSSLQWAYGNETLLRNTHEGRQRMVGMIMEVIRSH